jgi:hypothetical protein
MKVVVATHGHCFDGLASAAVFTQLMREVEGTDLQFCYHACGYGVAQKAASPDLFSGDHNAILDYRLTPSEKLTWYFDHHRTAFASAAERGFFEQRQETDRFFYEPEYSSCTKLIYQVGRERFGLQKDLTELIEWADLVDTASFSSADHATDRSNPIMQLVSVTEHYANDQFVAEMVGHLLTKPLAEVARLPEVKRRFQTIRKRHERFVGAVRTKAEPQGRVVLVDLTDRTIDLIGKFVTYALFPKHMYSVVVARLKRGFKISVGYNPWCGHPLDTDISAICARYGGGGHAVVGGISVAEGERARAQDIARVIVAELNG